MTTRSILLTLHLVGVAAWLGANLTQLSIVARFERATHEIASEWHKASGWLASVYYFAAGALIFVTGVLLVLDGPWKFSHGFVGIGMAVVVAGAISGIVFFGPSAKKSIEAHNAGDGTAARKQLSRFRAVAFADTAMLIFAVYAMVEKLAS